ncbi:MAG: hypothetical protein ACW97X_05930, partial [Candidatus Hodarchaeales archaeon]
MVANIVDEESSLSNYFEMLFKSETRALIAWNLIIHKELTVKQLSSLIAKDSSTVTRNLSKMKELKLVQISKKETVHNFIINYWRLVPNNILQNFGDFDTVIKDALIKGDLELIKLAMSTIQHNLVNILNYKTRDINKFVHSLTSGEEFISIGMMDERTGKLFRKELNQFICQFQDEHKLNLLPINEIGPDSLFTFLLASRF